MEEQDCPDCLICFCPIEKSETIYSCAAPFCSATSCKDCTEALIKYSASEGLLPKCPSKDCKSYYTLSGMSDLSKETISIYQKACLEYFIKDRGEQVKKTIQQEKILEKLRKERSQFIQSTFPVAVALVADITFSSKLRRLEKQKSIEIGHKVNASYRNCMNITCNGFLDKGFMCMTCQTEFCRKCEKTLKSGHVCLKEDIESLNFIESLIKCPKCKLPVIKSQGCDSITCSHCQTHFSYSTGKEGGHGSSNAQIKLNVGNKEKLSHTFRSLFSNEILQILLRIEMLEPSDITQDIVLTPLKKYYQSADNADNTDNTNEIGKLLAKKYDLYIKNKYQRQIYHQYLAQLEEMIKSNGKNCEQEFFEQILEKLNNVMVGSKTSKNKLHDSIKVKTI